MFAIYATHAAPDDPLSALKIGDLPEPSVPDGWVRVKVSHASLNRHDLFTLQGISGHPEGITYPIILGNDAAGTLDDGTPVVIYPMMGSDDWRGDETLDPQWHIPSEFVHGTFADYVVLPRRNAVPLPNTLSPLHASVLGTAWLTAYRALFTKAGLRAGQAVLIQGATGGMATALIQLGSAAGFEVWASSRTEEGRTRAEALGACHTLPLKCTSTPKGACRDRQYRVGHLGAQHLIAGPRRYIGDHRRHNRVPGAAEPSADDRRPTHHHRFDHGHTGRHAEHDESNCPIRD